MTPYCFIISWNRPIYLWATLDSLHRNTKLDVNFVLIDNNSTDPLVDKVIQGFERREMFHTVYRCEDNNPRRLQQIFEKYESRLGDYFFHCENDVVVPENVCWATTYKEVFESHDRVGFVGSFCLPTEFIDESFIREREGSISQSDLDFYVYSNSTERDIVLSQDRDATLGDCPTPPGRLILLGTEAVRECGPLKTDHHTCNAMVKGGYNWYVTPKFQHRHLSLNCYFDYPLGKDGTAANYREMNFDRFASIDRISFLQRLRRRVGLRKRLARLRDS